MLSKRDSGEQNPQSELERDRQLVLSIQSGSPREKSEAILVCVGHCIGAAGPIITYRLAHPNDRDDVMHDILVVILVLLPQYELRGKPLAHLYRRVAHILCMKALRPRKIDRQTVTESDLARDEDEADNHALDQEIASILANDHLAWRSQAGNRNEAAGYHERPELTQDERDTIMYLIHRVGGLSVLDRYILTLRYFSAGPDGRGQLTWERVAQLLNQDAQFEHHWPITAATVRQRHKRALEKLRRLSDLWNLYNETLC